MANAEASDLLMMFTKDGQPIKAASRTDFRTGGTSTNPLLKGFTEGCVFEINKFTFGAGAVDKDGPDDDDSKQKGDDKKSKFLKPTKSSYQHWRSGKMQAYPVDMHPVTFTRYIDSVSSVLMQNCIDCLYYDRVTLIKRKAVGNKAVGEAFMRFDFTNALVVSMDWSNDDEVEETCRLICRSVTINYRPQLPDGTLGALVPAFWSMAPGDKQVVL